MVQKGRTTVYIDMEKASRVKEDLGIDVSALTSQALDIADSTAFGDIATELRLKINGQLISETEDAIKDYDAKLIVLRKRLDEAVLRQVSIKENWEKTKREVKLSGMLYELNQVIVSGKYDEVAIKVAAADLIVTILELHPLFNLQVHIKELRKEMRD